MIAAARRADRFEQIVKTDQVDAVALLEIGLGLAGDHRGEMEDHIRTTGHQLAARILARDVIRIGVGRAAEPRRHLRRHHVDQGELVDRLAVQPAVRHETLGELAPDHAGGAGDENVHVPPQIVR